MSLDDGSIVPDDGSIVPAPMSEDLGPGSLDDGHHGDPARSPSKDAPPEPESQPGGPAAPETQPMPPTSPYRKADYYLTAWFYKTGLNAAKRPWVFIVGTILIAAFCLAGQAVKESEERPEKLWVGNTVVLSWKNRGHWPEEPCRENYFKKPDENHDLRPLRAASNFLLQKSSRFPRPPRVWMICNG